MLHDVIILVPFYICFSIFHKHHKETFFPYFSPEGNFYIDAGDKGGGPFRTPKHKTSQKITKTDFVRELFTLLGHFFKTC